MSFNSFSFHPQIQQAILRSGYATPTPIQQQAIPAILQKHDLLGLAQTGTGKTAAFILPTVQYLLQRSSKHVRALILAPTRELAEQINAFAEQVVATTALRSLAVYGGVSKQTQINRIRSGVDIIVACPGRLLDLHNDRAIDLSHVEMLILDEADIRRILRHLPAKRQSLVFSATMPDEIRHLAEDILHDPVKVQINPTRSVDSIDHLLYLVEQANKTDLLVQLLQEEKMATTLVFTRTKHKAKNLAQRLARSGFRATSLQGNLSQNRRQQALDGFKTGEFNVLVATDIAARGIDVTGISHVVNYDMPDTAEAYIHRTGRTGRASRTGEALTFATVEDKRMLRAIEQVLNKHMQRQPVTAMATAQPSIAEPPERERSTSRGQRRVSSKAPERTRSSREPSATGKVFGLARRRQ
jgi:superfamily II DNA/RNA helicase